MKIKAELLDDQGLTRWGLTGSVGPRITELGRAALAAYDAEQRRKICIEAMQKCWQAVYLLDIAAREKIEELIEEEEASND